jgi:hypothetical protein
LEKTHGKISRYFGRWQLMIIKGICQLHEGSHKIVIERPGQVISSDHMMSDYNERVIATDETGKELH